MTRNGNEPDPSAPEGESVGARVRRLRLAAGLTQSAIATPGLSASHVSLIESDRRRPSPGTVGVLAVRLGTTSEHLLTGVRDAFGDTETLLELAEARLLAGRSDAEEAFAAVLALPGTSSDRRRTRQAAWGLARARAANGNHTAAAEDLEVLRRSSLATDTRPSSETVASDLCRVYQAAGDLHMAIRRGEAAIDESAALGGEGPPSLVALLAECHADVGNATRARVLAEAAVSRLDASADTPSLVAAQESAARIAWSRGDFGAASDHALAAIETSRAGTAAHRSASTLVAMAGILVRVGASAEGFPEGPLRAAGATLLACNDVRGARESELVRGSGALLSGDPEGAARHAEASRSLGDGPEAVRQTVRALLLESTARARLGEGDAARTLAVAASESAAALGREYRDAGLLASVADATAAAGLLTKATETYRRALAAAGVPRQV